MVTVNPHIAGIEAFTLPSVSGPDGKRLIALAQNESAFKMSPKAIAAGEAALRTGQLYPDSGWVPLRRAIAEVYGLDPANILCGGGSMELIAAVMRCYSGPDHAVLGSQYAYAYLQIAARAAGARYDVAPEDRYTLSVDALLAGVKPDTQIVCAVNPGNPTGTRVPTSEIVRLRDELDDGKLLLIDEAYGEFADTHDSHTFGLVDRGNTIVLRTLSKAYGMAGMRVGWGCFPSVIAEQVMKLLVGNNVTVVSEAAGIAALEDQDYMQRVVVETARRRDKFAAQLTELGFEIPASHTNFVLIPFRDSDAAKRADDMLSAEGVVLRGMGGYGLPFCLRATIGEAADMDFVARLIGDWLENENR